MIPALANHRFDEEWTWDVLDINDNLVERFDGVTGGSIKKNVNATIRSGGSLSWSGTVIPDWLSMRLRPTYRATLVDGTRVEWAFGVFIPAAGKAGWRGSKAHVPVELYDKLLVLDEDKVDATFSLPAGSVIVTEIRSLIEGAGEEKHAISDSAATLTNAMTWTVGTTKLKIINDLLNTINYFSLWCDDAGFYRGDPYVSPTERGIAWNFADDEASIYSADFDYEHDFFGIPNKVILMSQGSGDAEGLVGVAENTDEEDPLSFPSRGRWVTIAETGVDAADQTSIDGLAARRLESLGQRSETLDLDHAIVQIDLNNLITFKRGPASLDIRGVIQEMEIPCQSGALVRTRVRRVK